MGTESIDINLARVRIRVTKGGHDVPEEDQRRRYSRSMRNMQAAFHAADEAVLYDNSSQAGFLKVAVKGKGRIELHEPLPHWAQFLRTPSRVLL